MKYFIPVIFLVGACSAQPEKTIRIAAASSLKNSLDSVISQIKSTQGYEIAVSYGGSQLLLSQIENGADYDIFISASEQQSNMLLQKKMISNDQIKNILTNKLILVSSDLNLKNNWMKKANSLKWSLGNKSVPVGFYSEQVIKNLKLKIPAENIIYSENVRQVVEIVRKKEADLSIIYETDYLQFKQDLEIIEILPDTLHEKIIYPEIILNTKSEQVKKVFQLIADSSQSILKHYGFSKF